MTTPKHSYAWLSDPTRYRDEGGVFYSLVGPNKLRVRLAYYRQVADYIIGLGCPSRKDFPKVADPKIFVECLMIMIDWRDDIANGFTLTLAPDERWFPKEKITPAVFEQLIATPLRPGRDYIPRYFTKEPLTPFTTKR